MPSAYRIATLLGNISPKTTCKYVTNAKETTNEAVCKYNSGTPKESNNGSIKCAIAGSPREPRTKEVTVIPI